MTRNAGGEVESSFIWRIKDDHQTGWAPSRVAKSRFVLKYFRTSAAFKRARRGLRRRGRRVEPATASRWTPSSRYAARVRDLPRRDTVRVPADHRARGEESIFSVPPRVPTKASLDGANPPSILRPSSTSVRTRRALNPCSTRRLTRRASPRPTRSRRRTLPSARPCWSTFSRGSKPGVLRVLRRTKNANNSNISKIERRAPSRFRSRPRR